MNTFLPMHLIFAFLYAAKKLYASCKKSKNLCMLSFDKSMITYTVET